MVVNGREVQSGDVFDAGVGGILLVYYRNQKWRNLVISNKGRTGPGGWEGAFLEEQLNKTEAKYLFNMESLLDECR